jgi:hypothetical protein
LQCIPENLLEPFIVELIIFSDVPVHPDFGTAGNLIFEFIMKGLLDISLILIGKDWLKNTPKKADG